MEGDEYTLAESILLFFCFAFLFPVSVTQVISGWKHDRDLLEDRTLHERQKLSRIRGTRLGRLVRFLNLPLSFLFILRALVIFGWSVAPWTVYRIATDLTANLFLLSVSLLLGGISVAAVKAAGVKIPLWIASIFVVTNAINLLYPIPVRVYQAIDDTGARVDAFVFAWITFVLCTWQLLAWIVLWMAEGVIHSVPKQHHGRKTMSIDIQLEAGHVTRLPPQTSSSPVGSGVIAAGTAAAAVPHSNEAPIEESLSSVVNLKGHGPSDVPKISVAKLRHFMQYASVSGCVAVLIVAGAAWLSHTTENSELKEFKSQSENGVSSLVQLVFTVLSAVCFLALQTYAWVPNRFLADWVEDQEKWIDDLPCIGRVFTTWDTLIGRGLCNQLPDPFAVWHEDEVASASRGVSPRTSMDRAMVIAPPKKQASNVTSTTSVEDDDVKSELE